MNVATNLNRFAGSKVGRHLLIYGFGASCLSVLKHTRTVIEGGFGVLDHLAAHKPENAALYATETAQHNGAGVMPPPDHPHAYDDEAGDVPAAAVIPPPPPAAPSE